LIVVDTSALMAIIQGEVEADFCKTALANETQILISAGTLAEALVVAGRRGVSEEMAHLVDGLGFEIVALTAAAARGVADAYSKWGKGVHPAGLNLGDCFAYQLAKAHDCSLLYVGHDFVRTDIAPARPRSQD